AVVRVRPRVDDNQVGPAVAIDVGYRQILGSVTGGGEASRGGEGGNGRSLHRGIQQLGHSRHAGIAYYYVGLAVAIDVRDRHARRGDPPGESLWGGEGGRARSCRCRV